MSCSPDLFDGMTDTEKRAWLLKAQRALLDLQTGGKGVSFTYAQGAGQKQVQYTQADTAGLTQLIRSLQQSLGIITRARRPIGFRYR